MIEVFKAINGYDGIYSISNYGRVVSHSRKSVLKTVFLTNQIDRDGYKYIRIGFWKTRKIYKIHRLVTMAFIYNPENKPFVNHKDLDRGNNRVDNLEWCTPRENCIHYFKTRVKPTKYNKV